MVLLRDLLRTHRADILQLATPHGAHDIRVFGSAIRGTERGDSDMDFLVTMDSGRTLLDAGGLQMDLQDLLGRTVDLVLDGNLAGKTGERIARTARPIASV